MKSVRLTFSMRGTGWWHLRLVSCRIFLSGLYPVTFQFKSFQWLPSTKHFKFKQISLTVMFPQPLTFLVSVTLCRSLYPRPRSTLATCSFLYTPWSLLYPFLCAHTSLHLEHISVDIGQLILRCLQESFRINMAFSCAPSRDSHRSLYISIPWDSVRRGETLSQLCLYPPWRP